MKAIYICLFLVVTGFAAQKEKLVLSTGFLKPEALVVKAIIEEASSRAGYELEFQILPNQRSLINANEGLNDGEAARIWEINKHYSNLYRVPVPSYSIDLMVLSKKKIEIRDVSNLKKYHIGVIRGMKIAEKIAEESEALSIVKSTSHKNLVRMLSDGRLDLIITNKIALFTDLNGFNTDTFYMYKTPILSRPLYIQLHTNSIYKIAALEKALKSMHEDGTYDKIKNSYLKSIEKNLPFSLKVKLYE